MKGLRRPFAVSLCDGFETVKDITVEVQLFTADQCQIKFSTATEFQKLMTLFAIHKNAQIATEVYQKP